MKNYYCWVIVACSFTTQVVTYGLVWTIGTWNSVFIREFSSSAAETSWIGSLLNAFTYLGGLISSGLIYKYSCRSVVCVGGSMATLGIILSCLARCIYVLYFTFSIISGLGLGLAFIPSIVIICDYFKDRGRTLALGIASSGAGFGSFIFPSINKFLFENFNWRMSLLINGGIIFMICIAGSFMIPLRSEKYRTGDFASEVKKTLHLFKNVSFSFLCLNNVMMSFGYTMVIVHDVQFFKLLEFIDVQNVSLLISMVGVSNLIGRIGFGVLCNYGRFPVVLTYCICNILQGVSIVLMPLVKNYYAVGACAIVFGFHSACMGPLVPEAIIQIVGPDYIGVGYGVILIFEGLGAMISPPIAGLIYDLKHSYNLSFYLGGIILTLAGLVLSTVLFIDSIRKSGRKKCSKSVEEKD